MDQKILCILSINALLMMSPVSLEPLETKLNLRKPSIPVNDSYLHLNLPDDSKDYQLNKFCHTVMCGISVSALKTLEDFDILELASGRMCTQLVFRDTLEDGQVGLNVLKDEKLVEQILFIRKKHPNQEVIISIEDKDEIAVAFDSYLYKSKKQEKLTTSVVSFMRNYNFTGLLVRLGFEKNGNSKGHQRSVDNTVRFIKMLSDLCKSNNWTFDVEIRPPYKHIMKGSFLGVLQNHSRFLILGVAEDHTVISHNFPLKGEESSLETMTHLLDFINVNKSNIVMKLPFFGEIYVPEINSSWNTNGTELVGCQGDTLADRDDLAGSGFKRFSEICDYLFDDDGNWTLFNDTEAHSMFLYDGNQWITAETTSSLEEKVEYFMSQGITRFALRDIHDDDYDGKGCKVTYPLLKSVLQVVISNVNCTGISTPAARHDSSPEVKNTLTWTVLVSLGSIGLPVITGGTIYLVYFFWNRKQVAKTVPKNPKKESNETNEVQTLVNEEVAELEVPPHEFQIYPDTVIGKGQFNIVLKGKILNDDVAVKIPKRNGSSKQSIPQQLSEIETLKLLNGHKNIIGLLGISTKLIAKGYIYQFLEFCPLGSLDKYLKANREKFVNFIHDDELHMHSKKSKLVEMLPEALNTDEKFNTKTLISWAYQICDGMEYISGNNVVHGDLAARNLLIQGIENIKICDFGMSRKLNSIETVVYNEQAQVTDKDAIPWRWLPYETLDKGMISITSDVWSYGVTVWEIFSLGEVPYAGLEWNSDFLNKLKDGLRLQAPRYSTLEMYKSFMHPCWALEYEERPSFLTIKANISHCIQNIFSSGYEEVNNTTNSRTHEEHTLEIEVLE